MKNIKGTSRRNFIKNSAGLALAASVFPSFNIYANHKKDDGGLGLADLPDYVSWKDRPSFIIHSDNTIETHRSVLGQTVITPNKYIYVRNNLPSMKQDEIDYVREGEFKDWIVRISGVRSPTIFKLNDLKKLGSKKIVTVLQCSGNGRGFFGHAPRGTQWLTGAAACVEWEGVPVKDVINACGGISSKTKFMTSRGGETIPAMLNPVTTAIERSQPISVIKHAILAWKMNGEDLSLAHGAPLRLIVPGYFGINNIKHLARLDFAEKESSFKIQRNSYRISPHGKKGPQYPSCWEMPVKSWITNPYSKDAVVPSGKVKISGVAMGGMYDVTKVKVSINGGGDWETAKFVGEDYGRFAWRKFELETNLKPGKYILSSKASNSRWQTQPMERMENERGYANNSWLDHSVTINVA